jgi:hypothetical protein
MLPLDVIVLLAWFNGPKDVVRIACTCKTAHTSLTAITERFRWKREKVKEAALISESSIFKEFPVNTIGQTWHYDKTDIETPEWAGVDSIRARAVFESARYPHSINFVFHGTASDTRETVRKLTEWFPERCENVQRISAVVRPKAIDGSDVRYGFEGFDDDLLKPFHNAKSCMLTFCDNLTDDAFQTFNRLQICHIHMCDQITASFVKKLVYDCDLWFVALKNPPIPRPWTLEHTNMMTDIDQMVEDGVLSFQVLPTR